MSVSESSPFGVFLSVAPGVVSIFLFLGPVRPVLDIIRKKQHDNIIPILPYLSMAIQSLAWMIYGILINNASVLAPNAVGCVLGWIYTGVYHYFSNKRADLHRVEAAGAVILVLIILLATALPKESATEVIGYIGCAGSIIFQISPLVRVLRVFRTKSIESMPIDLSVMLFLNGLLWTLYSSLVRFDIFILLPNSLGALSGLIQLCCHALYGNYCGSGPQAEPRSSKPAVEDEKETKPISSEEASPNKDSDIVLV